METIQLHNAQGQVIGTVDLPKSLEGSGDTALLWQAVRMYLANQRQGTADTKRRGEVRGGGRKPWRQKHTGRARHGSIRSPIWRKGGVVFGPHPREYRYELTQQIRRKALAASLRERVSGNQVVAVDGLDSLPPKTKAFAQLLKKIKAEKGALVVVDRPAPQLARISRNIPKVKVKPASDLTCYDVLAYPQLVVTSSSLKQLEALVG